MKKEKIQEYTLRISQSNRTQLVVVIYDILLTYLSEAEDADAKEDKNEFRYAVRKAQPFVTELMSALNFQYEISYELMRLYLYVNRSLALSLIKNDSSELKGPKIVIKNLRKAFEEISRKDSSQPLMKNTQQIYAGLTYGKGCLKEFSNMQGENRGFLA
ncbi:flagellar export chaperone FliS [Anaerosacchariphilus polymeriproducens]|uniref:Flagellar protein FliS n=1 Tax=Anaerosacchariphilus polymeriproducens TaxID=1812858 RepID=A0A371AZU2_9FIRM|nr:flagellar protein FliS [Anaerosacchariphilus polymeriproducens]RDU25069.1 flagellar protein FliS [Anaerosacchariphilus polymeriproducens]